MAARAEAAVSVRGVEKRYGRWSVVDGVSFEVGRGEVFALLGPNGAGKTTTVEMLEGYRRPDAGDVRVLGLDPHREGPRLKRRVGIMLQGGGMYPQITPREALRLFAAFYDDPEDPDALLERVELRSAAGTRYRRLSGGEKARLGLALALVGKPDLVFLDEPTAAMDPQARHRTWDIIRALRDGGVTVLLTTHYLDEAEQLADRVAIMDRGRLVALDTPAALRRSVGREVRILLDRPVDVSSLARALGLAAGVVEAERRDGVDEGAYLLRTEPTPDLLARLTGHLASEGVLLTELRAGSRSLEHAFLALTGDSGSPAR